MGAKKLRLAAFVFALGSCALLGCSGDTSSDNVTEHCGGTPSDAGGQGKSDAGVDVVTDATDAGQHEATVEAQPDAASDAEQRDASSPDAPGDTHADADAGAQADADASPPDVVADTSVDAAHDTSQGGDAASDSGSDGAASDGAATDGAGEAANDDVLPACTDYVNGNAVCSACEEDPFNCPHDPMAQPHCGDFPSTSDQALCKAVFECVRTNPCYANPISCLCGTATASTCPSAANGACLPQILAGLKTTSVAQAVAVVADVTLPGGAALALIQCDWAACPDSCIPYNAHCP